MAQNHARLFAVERRPYLWHCILVDQKRVLILAYTVAAEDPRVVRQINALKGFAEVTVAAKAGGESLDASHFVDIGVGPQSCWRTAARRLVTALLLLGRRRTAIAWLKQVRVQKLFRLQRDGFDVVLVNDVECLPAVYSNELGSTRVVLDVHEFSEDQFPQSLRWRLVVRPLMQSLARDFIPRVDSIMTVSEGLSSLLRVRHGRKAVVVMSVGADEGLEPTRTRDGVVRMVHVGNYSRTRGLDTLCEAADILGDGYTLDFYLVARAGFERFRRRWEKHLRITFHQPVPMGELVRTINRYDIGVYSLPPTSLNNTHALPNKFFQFLHGRVAVATGPSPEMARIVNEYRCGVVAEDFTSEAFARAIASLRAENLWRMKLGSDAAARAINAKGFEQVIREIVLSDREPRA